MKKNSSEASHQLLKPLIRREESPARLRKIEKAFLEFEELVEASHVAPELATRQKLNRANRPKDHWKDPIMAKSKIDLALAMYSARRISFHEYIFMVSYAVEGVHDSRIAEKKYPALEKLSSKMHQVENRHGLGENEYWPIKNAPPEYRRLLSKWSEAADKLFFEALSELEGRDAASLFLINKKEFEELRERGRRAFFHKEELLPALTDTIKRYELEAKTAAQSTAYTAAITMLGAAMEGLLLLRCLRSKDKSIRVAKNLPGKLRPKKPDTPTQWSFANLINVCLNAGWLPPIDSPTISIRPEELAHQLKQLRNQIHPGRVCLDQPWTKATRRDFDDAELIYTTLFARVFRSSILLKVTKKAD